MSTFQIAVTQLQFICFNSEASTNISKAEETRDNELHNLLLRNMAKDSAPCQDPYKVTTNGSSYNLNDHEKSV